MQGQIAPGTSMPATRHEVLYGERVVTCFLDRPLSLDAMLRAAVARKPDGIALVLGEQRVTYAQLDRIAENIARNLIAAGFQKGERIAMLLGNCLEFVHLALGASRAGMIVVPLNTRQRMPEIDYVLQQCQASALVYDADCEANLPAPRADLRNQWVVGSGRAASFAELMKDAPAAALPELHQEDTAFLLYTSGTTGSPKGAMLTHVSIIHSVLNFQHGYGLRDGDVSMLAVPASHVTGLVALILATINVAGTTVILPTFKAPEFLTIAARERMTYTLMVPAMYNLCLLQPDFDRHDLSAWRIAGFGGAPMPEATIKRLAEALPSLNLCNAYGSTETSSPATILPPGSPASKINTVGQPVLGARIVVVDDDGREVPTGQDGELLIAGAMVVPGYWDNPDGTRSGFVGGYWRSGDIGRIDADGYVSVVDRKKDMINRAGFKIYCTEVENVMSHHPAIVESAVIGKPDPVLGERVHAFAYSPDGGNEADIRTYCAERLSDYKVPDTITFLKEPLPRNANGKILKTELRKMMAS
ncbi:class I adenylate-forming enzyme family protein [Tardiphaga sp. P9-11]|uniref:class I adenylate-forming enzyme family protein n=1 Tax=Tardiphaga sp. P9-11 TaxID=2024614 RepID=UPI001FED9E7E|nr:class I adenylate-forming enzyme family protein [Tardiphaga sp. P9-11]